MNKTHKLTVMVEPELAYKLARIANARHCSAAQVVRSWIRSSSEGLTKSEQRRVEEIRR